MGQTDWEDLRSGSKRGRRGKILAAIGLFLMSLALISSLYMVLPGELPAAGDWITSDVRPTHGRYEFAFDESLAAFEVLGCYGEINLNSTSSGRAYLGVTSGGENRTSEIELRPGETTIKLSGEIPLFIEYDLRDPGRVALSSDIRAAYQKPVGPTEALLSAVAAISGAMIALAGVSTILGRGYVD